LPFSGVSIYPQNPLDFSPLSTYFINTYPAVLRVSYRFSGAALLNTYSDTYCGFNTRFSDSLKARKAEAAYSFSCEDYVMKIFLSSTFRDLEEERKKLHTSLQKAGFESLGMEFFVAESNTPKDVCLREVDNADLVLLIVTDNYGTIDAETGKSFTHLEFNRVKDGNKGICPNFPGGNKGIASNARLF
jgi:hypothetical protein